MFLLAWAVTIGSLAVQQPACAGDSPSPRAFVQALEAGTLPELVVSTGDCERGWISLRRFELNGDRRDAQQSMVALLRAARRRESAAWAYYGLGRLIVKAPWLNPGQQLVYVDSKSRAMFAAREALSRDPTLYEAAVLLGEMSLIGQDRKEIREVRDLLRTFEGPALAHVSPTIFELNTWVRDSEGVLHDAQLALAAGTSPVFVERARTIAFSDWRNNLAMRSYESAVTSADSTGLMLLFDDVRAIVSVDDTLAFVRGDVRSRREWLHAFWRRRAEMTGQTAGDRVAEHYRRLLTARERYAYPFRANRGGAPAAALLLQPVRALGHLDDRALIYLRHGEPTRVQQGTGTYLRPNETWYYAPPRDGISAFMFVPFDGSSGFRLVDDPFSVLDLGSLNLRVERSSDFERLSIANIRKLAHGLILDDLAEWFKSHVDVDPRYGFISSRLSSLSTLVRSPAADPLAIKAAHTNVVTATAEITAQRRNSLLAAAMGDSNIPKFARDLNIGYDIYGFRGNGGTDVTVAFGMRAAEVLDSSGNALRFSAAVQWRPNRVIRADTAFNIPLSTPLPNDASIASTLRFTLPPGEHPYFLTVSTQDEKAGRQVGGAHTIRDFSGAGLIVSDLVIASAGRQGTWRRGAASLALIPHARFPVDAAFATFYEVYNLAANEEFETELYLVREDEPLRNRVRGRQTELTVKFASVAVLDTQNGAVQELRNVQAALEPGRYRLTVTVRRNNGETASATRRITIY